MRREPERSCVGCRARRPKVELLRLVRNPEGRVQVDRSGRAPGRGAYVDRDLECVAHATRRGALVRALRVRMAPEDLATLRSDIEREIETN